VDGRLAGQERQDWMVVPPEVGLYVSTRQGAHGRVSVVDEALPSKRLKVRQTGRERVGGGGR